MSDMWRSRAPPTPLDFDAILDGSFHPRDNSALSTTDNGSSVTNGHIKGSFNGPSLRDQRTLTLKDNLELFISRYLLCQFLSICPYLALKSTNRLSARLCSGEDTISFDKDDDDTLDFVTASSNLRSYAYGIERKTRWEVKGLFFFSPPTFFLFKEFSNRNGWKHYSRYRNH